MAKNDLIMNHVSFNETGYMADIKDILNICLDTLSGHMHDVLCAAIAQCSEAAMVMIIEAQKNVKEISREVDNNHVSIEVGIDEGAIGGGEQGFVRVMVTLYGNHSVWARPGGVAWTKHVNTKRPNQVKTEYHLPYFEQGDHSAVMMKAFEHDIKKYVKDFLDMVYTMISSIDYSQYIQVS